MPLSNNTTNYTSEFVDGGVNTRYDNNHFLKGDSKSRPSMDDGGTSSALLNTNNFTKSNVDIHSDDSKLNQVYHSHGLYKRYEINEINERYRFGILNPYETLTNVREYLFFTKPDLNIYPRDAVTGEPSNDMAPYLKTQSYWRELQVKYPQILRLLQSSLDETKNPFNHLLGNMVQSNLEIPSLSSDMIDTPTNMYGVGYSYHGSSEASDDNFEFSLEFKDTRYLPVYHFFRAYEEYQTFKHHGVVEPYQRYILDKILYDHYSIYKFLVDEDGETILYYAKLYGVKSKSLPRDTFADTVFDNGISYTVEFSAAFFEDMKPHILDEFNKVGQEYCSTRLYDIDIFNHQLDMADNRPAQAAYVAKVKSNIAPGGYVYKLLWRGDRKQ